METGESTPLLFERLQQKDTSKQEMPVEALALVMSSKHLAAFELQLVGLKSDRDALGSIEEDSPLDMFIFQQRGPLMGRPKWDGLDLSDLARALAALLWLLVKTKPTSEKVSMKQTAVKRTQERKARQELAGRLCAAFVRATELVVRWEEMPPEGLEAQEVEDVLVHVLFRRLRLDAIGATTSVADLSLQTTLLPKSHCLKTVTCHPGWNAAAENVWRHRVPVGRRKGFTAGTLFQVYRFAWWLFAFATITIALSPAASYYASFNPLVERWESRRFHPWRTALWVLWLPTAVGWAAELIRTLVLGPLPLTRLRSLPLPAGSYTALISHAFILGFVVLRLLAFGHQPIASLAYILLAWSVPFQLLSLFVLPAGLPSLAPAFNKPATIRFKALRVLNDRIAAFRPFFIFFFVSLAFLVWAVNGEVELDPSKPGAAWPPGSENSMRTVSPIEVRSSLAVGVLFVALVAWLAGDAIASTASPTERAADIEEHAALEHLRYARLFKPAEDEAPPLPPPFNLLFLIPRAAGWALSFFDKSGGEAGKASKARRAVRTVRRGAQTAAWLLLWPQLWTVEKLSSYRS